MSIISVVVQHPVIMVLSAPKDPNDMFEGIIYDNYKQWSDAFNDDLIAMKRKWPIRNKEAPYYEQI